MYRFALMILVTSACATSLHAATAADLVGTWVVDAPATWDHLKLMPEITALSPEQLPLVKSTLEDQFKTTTFTFTTTTLSSTVAKVTKQENYTVSRTEGNTLYTDDTASDGTVTHSKITVAPNRLEITNLAAPSQIVVLERSTGTEAKPDDSSVKPGK